MMGFRRGRLLEEIIRFWRRHGWHASSTTAAWLWWVGITRSFSPILPARPHTSPHMSRFTPTLERDTHSHPLDTHKQLQLSLLSE
jgi:hypothetical protein